MPRKGQRLSRTTQRYSYNTRAHKRNDTYKFLKDGIRKSYRSTPSKRRSSVKTRSKGTGIKINLTEEQSALLLKIFLILYASIIVAVIVSFAI